MPALTCYKLRAQPDGLVSSFDDAIVEDKLSSLSKYGPIEIGSGTAKLYVTSTGSRDPDWANFLRVGFTEAAIPTTSSAGAVLIVRIERGGSPYFIAYTFGYGYMLLRSSAYERGFGLRTSLNVIFEGDDGTEEIDPARLRSVEAKRVGPTVLRSQHQVAESSVLEELDVDVRRDLLNGVTGRPMKATWGTRITGKDALSLAVEVTPTELDVLTRRIAEMHASQHYQFRFGFVDDMQLETDPVLRTQLQEEVVADLLSGSLGSFGLAPPEVVDWERVAAFRYHSDPSRPLMQRRELRLGDYLASLKLKGQFDTLDAASLRRYEIAAMNGSGKKIRKWSAWNCLFGTIELNDNTYVLDDGDFYAVSTDYMAQLNADLAAIELYAHDLRDWIGREKEKDYNEKASQASGNLLLMDRRTVKVSRNTSQVELCDLLSDEGALIHVKRRTDGSSSLSHLFAQGLVSGDLLVGSPEFRAAARAQIDEAEQLRAAAENDSSFLGRFGVFDEHAISPSSYLVVFAMLGDWPGGVETLPFFSRITLRQVVEDLSRRGLATAVKLVPAVPEPPTP